MQRVRLEFPEGDLLHRHPLTVRITDMNYGHHLGHDTLVSLLHEARSQALLSLGLTEWDLGGLPCVVADLAVQYHTQARWPDSLIVETAIPVPRHKAITVFHRVLARDDDRLVATARLNLLLLDPASGRVATVPDAVSQSIAEAGGL